MGFRIIVFIAAVFMVTVSYFSSRPTTAFRTSDHRQIASDLSLDDSETTIDGGNQVPPDLMIIIDRNPAVQQMKVFKNGSTQPTYTFPVSTGRETFDMPGDGINPYCSTTPTGNYKPQRLRELHYSNTWGHDVLDKDGKPTYVQTVDSNGKPLFNNGKPVFVQAVGTDGKPKVDELGQPVYQRVREGSQMPYSMFFNGGIATHCTTAATDAKIGQIASGGCVRMHPDGCRAIFNEVALKDTNGAYVKTDPRTIADDECAKGSTKARCTDPKQWPVKMKNLNVQVRVVDTRPEQDQKCVDMKCSVKQERYKSEKERCLRAKLGLGEDVNLKRHLETMITSDQRYKLNYDCNLDLEADYKANPRPQVSCAAPIPAPYPSFRGGNGGSPIGGSPQVQIVQTPVDKNHPIPPMDIPLPKIFIEPKPNAPNAPSKDVEGLWMTDFKPRQ